VRNIRSWIRNIGFLDVTKTMLHCSKFCSSVNCKKCKTDCEVVQSNKQISSTSMFIESCTDFSAIVFRKACSPQKSVFSSSHQTRGLFAFVLLEREMDAKQCLVLKQWFVETDFLQKFVGCKSNLQYFESKPNCFCFSFLTAHLMQHSNIFAYFSLLLFTNRYTTNLHKHR